MTIRKKLPINGVIEELYIVALMQIFTITSKKNDSLEINKDSEQIKQSVKDARSFAKAKINEYNNSIKSTSGIICEDLRELLLFADDLVKTFSEEDCKDILVRVENLEEETT